MLLVRISKKKKERAVFFVVVVVICDFSNKATISCGVVQGSILGLSLFIAYSWHTSMFNLIRSNINK